MASLAIFDFDRTIVNDDSDAIIIRRLKEKKPPPEWETSNRDWTPYMSNVFEHAYSAGLSQDYILDSISSMRPTPGMVELITSLADNGWDVLLITDANSVFVNHWLKTHGLIEKVTEVITNPAWWRDGRLYIEPCMEQSACARCPLNLCKAAALAAWRARRKPAARVAYAGDGANDFCPAAGLGHHATVFPRQGYPLDELIKKTLATPTPLVTAKVVPWLDAYTIIDELLPNKISME